MFCDRLLLAVSWLIQVVSFLLHSAAAMSASSNPSASSAYSTNTTLPGGEYSTSTTGYNGYPAATTSTTTTATYSTPELPARPVIATASDIHTTNVGPPVHSTASFTTNTGVASQPIDMSNQPLVKPSSGLMHSFNKMTLGGQRQDLQKDPVLLHADQTLNASMNGARQLHAEIQRYQQAQQALQNAALAVANAFHAVLSDETNPYASVSAELVRQVQLHSFVPSQAEQLTALTNGALEDSDGSYASVRNALNTRKTKASDVEYYTAKVQKLTADHEATMAKGEVRPADKERLERNIGKMREIEMEYNAENARLISDMNALWRRRILRLGPALSTFIMQNELQLTDVANMYRLMSAQSRMVNPDVAHHMYLTSSATMLVPVGSAYVDNRELINQAHQTGIKGDVTNEQRRLAAERDAREGSVSKAGGSLETVAQATIVRSEEQMRVMKERFVTERVRLRKVVSTEMVTITVPVRKERVEVERIPVDGPGIPISAAQSLEEDERRSQRRKTRNTQQTANANTKTTTNTNTGTSTHTADSARVVEDEEEESYEMILSEERPRVINDVVPIERVRLRKLRQVSSQQLQMDLLREHIDYAAPHALPGQQQTVTLTGQLQTVAGQNRDGFTDTTGGNVHVITNRPVAASTTTSTAYGREPTTVKADVDDVEAMKRVGYGDQAGAYGQVNTVGMVSNSGVVESYSKEPTMAAGHPYGAPAISTAGAANTFDNMAATSDLTTSTNPSTTSTSARPVV